MVALMDTKEAQKVGRGGVGSAASFSFPEHRIQVVCLAHNCALTDIITMGKRI